MLLEYLSPVVFQLGPVAVRWYGLMFALSLLAGFYYLRRDSLRRGIDENDLFAFFMVLILALVIGARALYVVANWSFFSVHPEMIVRIDRGGLAFHGGLAGGLAASWLFCRAKNLPWHLLADLSVPGITAGIALVRVANIFNQEILGREAGLFFFERHPAQVYGSLIGLTLLLVHNYRVRRAPGQTGSLFWGFVLGYSLLRGLVEETFRDNPLVAWGYINDPWGAGFFTAVQLATPALVLLSLVMLRTVQNSRDCGLNHPRQKGNNNGEGEMLMARASWKGSTLAESSETVVVEGNHYFPPADVDLEYLIPTDYRTTCPWKGEAHYYNVVVDGEKNVNAAWTYPQPKEKARHIAGYFAFWKDIKIDAEG